MFQKFGKNLDRRVGSEILPNFIEEKNKLISKSCSPECLFHCSYGRENCRYNGEQFRTYRLRMTCS